MKADRKNMIARQTLYEDNLFRDAIKEAARIEGESLLQENSTLKAEDAGVSIEKQKEFKDRLEKALKDKRNEERRLSRIKTLQRVAVIILALGSVLAASLFSVDAFRVKVLNFFMETKPEYTEFRLEESKERGNDEKVVDWSNSYMPTYVPEGYTVEFSENGSAIKSILFQNAEGKIIDYTQHTEAANFNYDTESASSREITVNEKGGTLIVKEGTYSIVWKYEKSIFVVMTQIDEQETLKIAENIKFMK